MSKLSLWEFLNFVAYTFNKFVTSKHPSKTIRMRTKIRGIIVDKCKAEERETNKMQLIWCFIPNFISTCFGHHYAHHQKNKSVHCRIWCSALVVMAVVVWSWDAICVHCEGYWRYCWNSDLHTEHTARVPAPHNHSHHNQCRTPYAAVHTLVLLMMGIMMPETCWDKVWYKTSD